MRITRPLEQNVLPDVAYTILRRSEVLSDNLLSILREAVQSLENGEITFDQAVAIIRHSCGKHD
jgi:hypothetical protein